MADDRPTRDQRGTLYAQGVRDLTVPPAVRPDVQRVSVVDDTSRSLLPSGSPMAGFRGVRAAPGALFHACFDFNPGARGAVVCMIRCASNFLLCNGEFGMGGPITESFYKVNYPADLPGRSDENSGIAFGGAVYTSGTATPYDFKARTGTLTVADVEPVNGAGILLDAGTYWLPESSQIVLLPYHRLQIVQATENAALECSILARAPLIPSPRR
jgi:hypothetical protein